MATRCLNEQNPERGIETPLSCWEYSVLPSLNEQNPERGIETGGSDDDETNIEGV